MNGKDILLGLGDIDERYIEEAAHGEFPKSRRLSLKRPLVIAAVVAMMLMLVGCAAVYVMHMKDLKVGQITREEPAFGDDYWEYLGTTEVPYDVLSINGIQDTPAYHASMEWFEFTQSYDPDYKIWYSVLKNLPKFSQKYDAYRIYTQEMADKADEICEKYDLKVPGEGVAPKNYKVTQAVLGVDSFLYPDAMAGMAFGYVQAYEGGNFNANFSMLMDEGEGRWQHCMNNYMYYLKKDYFDPSYIYVGNPANWKELNYTTARGYNVLLLYSADNGCGWVIYDREDAVITVNVNASYSVLSDVEAERVSETISLDQLKQVVDAIDFGIQPNINIDLAK